MFPSGRRSVCPTRGLVSYSRSLLGTNIKSKTFEVLLFFALQYREWDFLRKSLRGTCKNQKEKHLTSNLAGALLFASKYREWDLNPHSRFGPKDFKSFVSTDSTIAASKNSAKIRHFIEICKFFIKNHKKICSHLQISEFLCNFVCYLWRKRDIIPLKDRYADRWEDQTVFG